MIYTFSYHVLMPFLEDKKEIWNKTFTSYNHVKYEINSYHIGFLREEEESSRSYRVEMLTHLKHDNSFGLKHI